jgi:tRNA A-37 threonylcarbamoyl transferase component Bud32
MIEHMSAERQQEAAAMSVHELKTRLLKLAQAYKAARVRNAEFEAQFKRAYEDIEGLPKVQKEVEEIQREHRMRAQQLLEMQEETQ